MRPSLFVGTLASLFLTLSAQAETRIATVDMARLINESPDAASKKKDLDTTSEEIRKKVEAKAKDLQALKTKLESSKVSADSKEAESFRNQARDFERLRSDAKADLEKKYMKINQELTAKVFARIEEYAKANDYDLVVDKSAKGRGPILYGNSAADITDEILKGLK